MFGDWTVRNAVKKTKRFKHFRFDFKKNSHLF